MDLREMLPASWQDVLSAEFDKPYFAKLEEYLEKEYETQEIHPPKKEIFAAFHACDFDDVKVLLLGQDPYPTPGQAHGLSFSVKPGVRTPASLRNIYKELEADVGCTIPNNGCLTPWANQGVLLLNAVFTVRSRKAASHRKKGWETFSDAVIDAVNKRDDPVIFFLWGGFAKDKASLIDGDRHTILEGAHPSPLNKSGGFFGERYFSKANAVLKDLGKDPIDWQIPQL